MAGGWVSDAEVPAVGESHCATDQHPKGVADYGRFVRKHDRYFPLSAVGDITSGVAHVDPPLSPFRDGQLTGPIHDRAPGKPPALILPASARDGTV